MANTAAILGGVAAAAPGVAQGVNKLMQPGQVNASDASGGAPKDAMGLGAPGAAPMQAIDTSGVAPQDGARNPFADPAHPAWQAFNNLTSTGNPGNAPLPGGGAPAPQVPAPAPNAGISTDANGRVNAPISMAAQANMQQPVQQLSEGGVVRTEFGAQLVHPQFQRGPAIPVGPNSGIVPASTEGQILTMADGGSVPGSSEGFIPQQGVSGIPMTGPAAGFVQGFQGGQTIGHNLRQAWLEHEARGKSADFSSQALGIDDQNQSPDDGSDHPEGFLGKAKDAVEGFFHHLHEGTLNDDHKPNGPAPALGAAPPAGGSAPSPVAAPAPAPAPAGPAAASPQQGGAAPSPVAAPPPAAGAGAPAPAAGAPAASGAPGQPAGSPPSTQQVATADAVKVASADPGAQSGTPQETPAESEKPHSLDANYWRDSNKKLQQAVAAAARAGEDPGKIYESLTAMRTAHFQGQILRNLGAANVALQNGDQTAVKTALANVNYYLPNGQGIKFKTATAADAQADPSVNPGQLMYRNPFYGMYGHQNEPEFTSVTPQHLQILGAAALDPRTVQDTILKSYSAQAAAEKEHMQAQGEYLTGQGRKAWGDAQVTKANVDQAQSASRIYLNFASGEQKEASAGYLNRKQDPNKSTMKVSFAQATKLGNDARAAFRDNMQGKQRTEPTMIPNPNKPGQMMPNLSPAAGKAIHSPNAIPTAYKNLSADQQQDGENLASTIAQANPGVVGQQEAGDLAARYVAYRAAGGKSTHLDPDSHKPTRDFVYDDSSGVLHMWTGAGWKSVRTVPNIDMKSDDRSEGAADAAALDTSGGNDASEPEPDSQNMN